MTSGGAFSPAFANTTEKLIATIMILLSGVFWSQLIGVLCGIAANLSPATQAFRKEMGELNNFMNNNPGLLDQPTRYRLREYLHQSVHVKNIAAQKNILGQFSPGLHSEVVWKVTERWLSGVRFLRGVEKELLVACAPRPSCAQRPAAPLSPQPLPRPTVHGPPPSHAPPAAGGAPARRTAHSACPAGSVRVPSRSHSVPSRSVAAGWPSTSVRRSSHPRRSARSAPCTSCTRGSRSTAVGSSRRATRGARIC